MLIIKWLNKLQDIYTKNTFKRGNVVCGQEHKTSELQCLIWVCTQHMVTYANDTANDTCITWATSLGLSFHICEIIRNL